MNRRSFLKFCGIAPAVPGLAVGALSYEPVIWIDAFKARLEQSAKDLASFENKPGWEKIIAEAFPPVQIMNHPFIKEFPEWFWPKHRTIFYPYTHTPTENRSSR